MTRMPKLTDADLLSPQLILRVKRRVGPSMWSVVEPVLTALVDALQVPLDMPDPRDPTVRSTARKSSRKIDRRPRGKKRQ